MHLQRSHPIEILTANHYHNPDRTHPRGAVIDAGTFRIELLTAGRGWVKEGEEWREVGPGTLIWHREGDRTIERSDFESPYRCLNVIFRVKDSRDRPVPRFSFWPNIDEAIHFSRETVSRFVDDGFDRELLRDYAYTRLLYQARSYHFRRIDKDLPEPLVAALRIIADEYASPQLRMDLLAERIGWSVPHMHDQFKRFLNTTPGREIRKKRFHVAREQLVSSNTPVKRIAVDCGFARVALFSYAFKKSIGMTPSEFRRRYYER